MWLLGVPPHCQSQNFFASILCNFVFEAFVLNIVLSCKATTLHGPNFIRGIRYFPWVERCELFSVLIYDAVGHVSFNKSFELSMLVSCFALAPIWGGIKLFAWSEFNCHISSISIQLVLVLQMGFSAFNYARADYQDLLQCHKDQTMEIWYGRAPSRQGHLQR